MITPPNEQISNSSEEAAKASIMQTKNELRDFHTQTKKASQEISQLLTELATIAETEVTDIESNECAALRR